MKYSICLLLSVGILLSCKTPKNITYFRDIPDTIKNIVISDTGYKPLTTKADDLLQINITSPNAEANQFFLTPGSANASGSTTISTVATTTPNTYLVDKEGGIDLPLIGRVYIAGLTIGQIRELIMKKSLIYLKDPVVTVKLQNFKVTVLGEVNKPANYIILNERVSILDAIGMAGDLTIFGKRENILLIREQDKKKNIVRLNLNSSALLTSPYYYLQQNDIIYIEPNKSKVAATDVAQIRSFSLITALASLAIVFISRVIK